MTEYYIFRKFMLLNYVIPHICERIEYFQDIDDATWLAWGCNVLPGSSSEVKLSFVTRKDSAQVNPRFVTHMLHQSDTEDGDEDIFRWCDPQINDPEMLHQRDIHQQRCSAKMLLMMVTETYRAQITLRRHITPAYM